MSKSSKHGMGITRRGVLKGGAAVAGFAAGSGVVTGFPTIWAQNIKDVTLNHTGQSYSTLIDIARQASQDLGFKVEMSVTDHPGMTNRIVNDPASIDIADCEIWQTKVFVPLGKTQCVDVKKIKAYKPSRERRSRANKAGMRKVMTVRIKSTHTITVFFGRRSRNTPIVWLVGGDSISTWKAPAIRTATCSIYRPSAVRPMRAVCE